MNNIKKYNKFVESQLSDHIKEKGYNIYQFWSDVNYYAYHNTDPVIDIKKYSDKYIGNGVFDKVNKLVDNIFNALNDIDIDNIKDKMADIFDEFLDKKNNVSPVILIGDISKYESDNQEKFNGTRFGVKDKMKIICLILSDMLYPTLWIGSSEIFVDHAKVRNSHNEIFVEDEIYQCVNFNIHEYEIFPKLTNLYKLESIKKYNVDNFYGLYKPGIYIGLGDSYSKQDINVKDIEEKLDDILPFVLHGIEYEDILWEYSRKSRKFDPNINVQDYSIKILLKI